MTSRCPWKASYNKIDFFFSFFFASGYFAPKAMSILLLMKSNFIDNRESIFFLSDRHRKKNVIFDKIVTSNEILFMTKIQNGKNRS